MQLERVSAIAVRRVVLEVLRQVDNVDGLEGALLNTDTATDAELKKARDATVSNLKGPHRQTEQQDRTSSEMKAILLLGVTSMQSLPVATTRGTRHSPTFLTTERGEEAAASHVPMRTTGHDLRHSWRHFLGLHLSALTMAIRVSLSDMAALRSRPPWLPERL